MEGHGTGTSFMDEMGDERAEAMTEETEREVKRTEDPIIFMIDSGERMEVVERILRNESKSLRQSKGLDSVRFQILK